jgi:hypothetical protein
MLDRNTCERIIHGSIYSDGDTLLQRAIGRMNIPLIRLLSAIGVTQQQRLHEVSFAPPHSPTFTTISGQWLVVMCIIGCMWCNN